MHGCVNLYWCSRDHFWIAASWGSVVNDLDASPLRRRIRQKKAPNRRRRIGRRRRIVKTHWVAQMHREDALGGADALGRRRRIAKTHWVGEDALG